MCEACPPKIVCCEEEEDEENNNKFSVNVLQIYGLYGLRLWLFVPWVIHSLEFARRSRHKIIHLWMEYSSDPKLSRSRGSKAQDISACRV